MRGIEGTFLIVGDGESAPILRGAVVLDANGVIMAVGEAAHLRRQYTNAAWEAHRAVLLPGLVNAHTHLELSALRGRVPGGRGFGPWVTTLMEERELHAPERDESAIAAAVSELLEVGTAAVGEVTNTLAGVADLGGAPLIGCVFHEVFGMRHETAEVMLAMAQARHAEVSPWPDHLAYAPAPHTTYTVHPEILQTLVGRARALRARSSLHLCEHPAERAYLAHGGGAFAEFLQARGSSAADWPPPGLDPVRYASSLGALAPDVICVHLADARPDELELVAQSGAPVVLCPRSNLHIELKLPPLIEILRAGLRPGLGTDSLASNTSLDVLGEARALHERFPSVPPRTLLAMATGYGAEALGLGDRVGRLAAGLSPGVLAFPHGEQVPADPERFVLSRTQRQVLARPRSSGWAEAVS